MVQKEDEVVQKEEEPANDENEELANEEEITDDEVEESRQKHLVLTQAPAIPQPFSIQRGLRETRQPKPFYPSPPAMSFGNIRHTVNDKIGTIRNDGDRMTLTKREINAIHPVTSAKAQNKNINPNAVRDAVEEVVVQAPLLWQQTENTATHTHKDDIFCGSIHSENTGDIL